ncbi:hypothetical protein BDM02DRAFT_2800239 [Thelephora ganbajun]|uniref:Uncharacterized protein n=1 Tax=Thelephora ganbajun TaxID=370292 RepID=A0ACB6ZC92_THEGA|nr:hypothetical protein BDM02DRAFT_2800239 [Thelephora ganbajun]
MLSCLYLVMLDCACIPLCSNLLPQRALESTRVNFTCPRRPQPSNEKAATDFQPPGKHCFPFWLPPCPPVRIGRVIMTKWLITLQLSGQRRNANVRGRRCPQVCPRFCMRGPNDYASWTGIGEKVGHVRTKLSVFGLLSSSGSSMNQRCKSALFLRKSSGSGGRKTWLIAS